MPKPIEIGNRFTVPEVRQEDRADYLVHRQVAEEIHGSVTGDRVHSPRPTWPGRRSDDHRGWIAAIVIAFLAVLSHSTPEEWKLDPPHSQQRCR